MAFKKAKLSNHFSVLAKEYVCQRVVNELNSCLREHTKLDTKNENKLGGNGPDVYLQAKRPRVIPPDRSGVFPLRRLA